LSCVTKGRNTVTGLGNFFSVRTIYWYALRPM
jgi:hypothetical protein